MRKSEKTEKSYHRRGQRHDHQPGLLFWGSVSLGGTCIPPPTSGDLLCQLLEADGSPLCGGPVGSFPDMGVPRVRLGREDRGHCSEEIWLLLGHAQGTCTLVAAQPCPPLSP